MANNEVYPMLNETVEYKSVKKSSKLCSYILNFVRYLICIACAGFLAFFVHQYMVDDNTFCIHRNMTDDVISFLGNIPLVITESLNKELENKLANYMVKIPSIITQSLHEEMDRLATHSQNLEYKIEDIKNKMLQKFNNTII